MKNTEIEIKVQTSNAQPLLDFLEQNGQKIGTEHQIDEYFSPAHRNFVEKKPVKEWLRLRNSDGVCSINYKNWIYNEDGKSNHCDEYESTVGDFENMQKIFKALDIKSLVTVDKLRTIWKYENYEISIDTVVQLGDFIEIEYKSEEENMDTAKIATEMESFLKNLGCTDIERNYVGYPFLLLFGNNQ